MASFLAKQINLLEHPYLNGVWVSKAVFQQTFNIIVHGRYLYHEEYPACGTYTIESRIQAGCCGLLTEVFSLVNCAINDVREESDHQVAFLATTVEIRDRFGNFVIAGSVFQESIHWLPLNYTQKAKMDVQKQLDKLTSDRINEMRADNYASARQCHIKAQQLGFTLPKSAISFSSNFRDTVASMSDI